MVDFGNHTLKFDLFIKRMSGIKGCLFKLKSKMTDALVESNGFVLYRHFLLNEYSIFCLKIFPFLIFFVFIFP